MQDNDPIFVDLDVHNVLFTQEDKPRSFLIRPNGGRTVAITLEGDGTDEVIAQFEDENVADDAYYAASQAVTFNDAIAAIKARENAQ